MQKRYKRQQNPANNDIYLFLFFFSLGVQFVDTNELQTRDVITYTIIKLRSNQYISFSSCILIQIASILINMYELIE